MLFFSGFFHRIYSFLHNSIVLHFWHNIMKIPTYYLIELNTIAILLWGSWILLLFFSSGLRHRKLLNPGHQLPPQCCQVQFKILCEFLSLLGKLQINNWSIINHMIIFQRVLVPIACLVIYTLIPPPPPPPPPLVNTLHISFSYFDTFSMR